MEGSGDVGILRYPMRLVHVLVFELFKADTPEQARNQSAHGMDKSFGASGLRRSVSTRFI